MRKLYEIFKLIWIKKRIVTAATIWGNIIFVSKVKALKPQVILLSTALHTFAWYKRIRRIVNHNVKNVVLNLDATIGLHFLTKRGLSFWKIRHTTQDFESRVRWYVLVGYRARDGRYQAGYILSMRKFSKASFQMQINLRPNFYW